MMGKNANAFDFLLGEWDITVLVMPEGSTVGRRAKSQVHRILDGTALLNFRGASFRTYVPDTDACARKAGSLQLMRNSLGRCTEPCSPRTC
jgi:hypothetical protein